MNRFAFIGTQVDEHGQEWCYVLDTQTGTTLKSPVKTMGAGQEQKAPPGPTAKSVVFPVDTVTAPVAVKDDKPKDPAGEIETKEEREKRLAGNKVPPAFLGDIRRMSLDPAKTDGRTDVTRTG